MGGTTKADEINAKITGNGDISFTGAVTSTGGNVTANVSGTGKIETGKYAAVDAAKDISFTTNNGDIQTNSSLNAGNDVTLTTKTTGNITTNGKVAAGNNFTANTNSGDILFNGNVTAKKDINVNVNTQGKISTSDGAGESHSGAKLEAGNNMTIQSKYGDIDMHELYAKNNLEVIASNGNINLCDINGDIVTIVLKTQGTQQQVDKITAGAQIVLEGSDVDLDQIERRVDADGMLVITPKGIDGNAAMDNFRIGSINSKGGIRLSQIWAKDAEVNVLGGKFHIDKLFIENEGHFSRGDFTTAVYGKAPVDDGSNSTFWNNPKYNPANNLDSWKNAGQNGYYFLHFEEHPAVQRSNMVLVNLDDYHYVYNQRFTGVNHTRYLEGDGIYELYLLTDGPGAVLYNRYYNYDLPEMVHNADADELVIESEKV